MKKERGKQIKRTASFVLAFALVCSTFSGMSTIGSAVPVNPEFQGEEWYDQLQTYEVNREPGHALFIPYESASKALENEASALDEDEPSAYYQKLSGKEWDFALVTTPAEAKEKDKTWLAETLSAEDQAAFNKEYVPQSWQTYRDERGDFKYDSPIYTNQSYPWQNFENRNDSANGYAATVYNPVGYYRTTFETPDSFDGRQTFITFEGVESAYYVYVNGHEVGYSEDSYTAHDFNITPYLHTDGTPNTLAVKVFRWSDGSFLENQDFIRLSGIFRDVSIYSKANVELRDFFVHTTLDDKEDAVNSDATLALDVDVRSLDPSISGDYNVTATLYDMDDQKIESMEIPVNGVEAAPEDFEERIDTTGTRATGSMKIENPDKWFADTPNLYKLLIELKDSEGNVIETACQRVGFREVDKVIINDDNQQQMQINGEKIVFRGVNRHESDLNVGRAIDKEEIIYDLKMMKQFNVNAIRTSHYPENKLTYELADELGLYICAEANIESHSDLPSANPEFNGMVLDRTQTMVENLKNHPSVVIWSLGNEATYASANTDREDYCFRISSDWILERDPSRMRKYERDNNGYGINTEDPMDTDYREQCLVDVYSVQYPAQGGATGYAQNGNNKIPYIWSEYAHSMGNALGSFDEYWKEVRSNENVQGGFIWDWKDQSIATRFPENTTFHQVKDSKTGILSNTEISDMDAAFAEGRDGTLAAKSPIFMPAEEELNANSTEGITLEAWVKPNSMPSADQAIISKGDGSYNLKYSATNGSHLEFFVNGWSAGTLTVDLPDNYVGEWHHLVGTLNADGVYTMYIDGKEAGSKTVKVSKPYDNSLDYGLGIGNDPQFTSRAFDGLIDSARVYNRALTAEEVANAYAGNEISASDDSVVFATNFAEEDIPVTGGTDYPEEGYFWGYGGDWIDSKVNDNWFCGNGVVYADGTPSAKLYEVKKVHQEVSFYDDGKIEDGEVRVVNEFLNTNLDNYDITWELKEDDQVINSGTLDLNTAPQTEETVQIDLGIDPDTIEENSDYLLNFSVRTKEDTAWAEAGFEVAYEQFELEFDPAVKAEALNVSGMNPFTSIEGLEDDADVLTASGITDQGQEFSFSLNKTTGVLENYTVDGTTLIEKGPVLNLYRATIDNDGSMGQDLKNIFDTMTDPQVEVSVPTAKETKDKVILVSLKGDLGINAANQVDYKFYSNGDIVVTNSLLPNASLGNLPRVGMKMEVNSDLQNMEYYGRGPVENYSDRNSGSLVDVYNTDENGENLTVDGQEFKYLHPQEFANRTDVRWTSLTDENGNGLMIAAEDTMETGATRYQPEAMGIGNRGTSSTSAGRHIYQIEQSENIVWTVDYMQRGLGNNSCGGSTALPAFQVPSDRNVTHSFRIIPITNQTDKMEESKLDFDTVFNVIDKVTINGVEMASFDPVKTDYEMSYLEGSFVGVPLVEVEKTSDDAGTVEIQQADGVPGTAVITATDKYGVSKTYTINFTETTSAYAGDMQWMVNECGYSTTKIDRSIDGNPLKLTVDGKEKTFAKGIGTHATSRIVIDISGKGYERFQAMVGVDREQYGNTTANLEFRVYFDDDSANPAFESGAMRSTSEAQEVVVDIPADAKTITLYVDELGGNGNDHADWADAQFICSTAAPVIESIQKPESVTVETGTSFEELTAELPTLVATLLDTGKLAYLPVTWEQGDYDGDVAGTYTLNGVMEVPEDVTNNAGQPTIEVIVSDDTPVPTPSGATVNYNGGTVKLTIDGEEQKLADLIGSYHSDAEAGSQVEMVFKPAVEGRVIQSVTINGEVDETFTGGTEYTYILNVEEENEEVDLQFTVTDRTILDSIIDYAKGLVEDGVLEDEDRLEEVKEKFRVRLDTAVAVQEDYSATQEEINQAWSDLLDIIHVIDFSKGDKTTLDALIKSVENLQKDGFTSSTWDAFEKALAEAQKVNDDVDAMQDEITEAYNALDQAIKDLQFVSDKDQLNLALTEAKKVLDNLGDYSNSQEEKDALQRAYDAALKVYNDEEALQDEVEEVTSNLTSALAVMRLVPNRGALEELVNELSNKNLNKYTAASANAFRKALNAANDGLADPNLTEKRAKELIENLELAEKNLKTDSKGSSSSGSGSSSNRKPVGNTSGEGTAVAVMNGASTVANAASVVSDTTVNFTIKRGSAYCFKMTVVNGNNQAPSFTVGNGNVLKTQFVAKVGNDYYYRVYAIGTPGQSTGVYTTLSGQNAVKHCTVTIG